MRRFLSIIVLLLLAALWFLWRSGDWRYTAMDWLSFGRYQKFDLLIADAAAKHGVDPLLVKAVVWRESQFHAHKTGASGERGLMQVSEAAAQDWVRAHKARDFSPDDLFSPGTNLEIGTWYLRQKLNRWAGRDDPLPFALAEYNAGGRRVDRWAADKEATAADLRSRIGFPSTTAYVEAVLRRYEAYRRGEPGGVKK